MRSVKIVTGLIVAVAMMQAACTSAKARPQHRVQYSSRPRFTPRPRPTPPPVNRPPQTSEIEIGRSVGGRAIVARFYGTGEQATLILATIHGNEAAGTPLVERLGRHLLEHPELLEGRRVIIVPVANPDGMHLNARNNLRGVDLNRNFPADNYRPSDRHGSAALSEPESRALMSLLAQHPPDRIISIHQPLECIDYDGPGERLARALSSTSGLPLKKLGGKAGSLGSYAGIARRIPIVTVELPRSADSLSADRLWARYGRMLLVGICFPDSVPQTATTALNVPGRPARSGAADHIGN